MINQHFNSNRLPIMKPLLIILGFALLSCNQVANTKQNTNSNPIVDTIKTSHTAETLVVTESDIVGTWSSLLKVKNGINTECIDTHRITFNPDHTFHSFYKPSNYKSNTWVLRNDIIELYLKAPDDYKIIDISDSTMQAQFLPARPDTVVMHYRKVGW